MAPSGEMLKFQTRGAFRKGTEKMWIVRKGSAGYHVGYYRPDSTFITIIATDGNTKEDLMAACRFCHYMNGGSPKEEPPLDIEDGNLYEGE